jgi:hypothetical protein
MTNYISLRSALAQIPKPLFTQSNESDFYNWMIDGLRLLPDIVQTEPKMQIFEIIDGKLCLPKEVKQINLVSWMYQEPCQDDIGSFAICTSEPEAEPLDYNSTNICRYTINYKLFLDSTYYNNNFVPLKYAGNISNPYLCKFSPNRFERHCAYMFTVDKNKVLWTSSGLPNGFLAIDYDAELLDDNDNILIPDYQEVKDYLVKYSLYKHWEERMSIKEESANQIFQKYQQEVEMAFKKAKGEILGRNLDADTVANINSGNYKRLIQIPEKLIYARQSIK